MPETTATITAPEYIAEDRNQTGFLTLTLLNVTQWDGNVSMSFNTAGSTITNGSDVNTIDQFFGVYHVNQAAGTFTINLPSFTALSDQLIEGTEILSLTVTVSGQTFANGTNTITVNVPLVDSGQTGTSEIDLLNGTMFRDQLRGFAGNDTLSAGAGSDLLIGGAGTDTMSGGDGADTFRGTAAELNGDRITDLSIGDHIHITDLTVGGLGLARTASAITYNGGSIDIDNIGAGRLIVKAAASGGVDVRLDGVAHNDFNRDGNSDILWRNTSGAVSNWLGNPANNSFTDNAPNSLANPGSQWKVAATGDFNGDGYVDILWRHTSGVTTDWLGKANGGYTDNGGTFAVNPGTQWNVASVGDFNGDGKSDILWRHDSGLITEWIGQANGGFADNAATFSVNTGPQWQIAATGDFNGDGHDDLIWRHDSGYTTEWLGQGNGSFTDNAATFAVNTGPTWHLVGSGDFNGDGSDDLMWRNDSGVVTNWLSQPNGGFVDNAVNFRLEPGTAWHVVEIADFNGDSTDDIMWQHNDGTVTNWLSQSNGGVVDNSAHFWINPGAQWSVQDPFVHDPFPFA